MVRAANCIGESLLITDGDLIGSTPASKIYVARNTLLEEVATITAAVKHWCVELLLWRLS